MITDIPKFWFFIGLAIGWCLGVACSFLFRALVR